MKDSFKFRCKNGITDYTAVKIADDSAGDPDYLISWEGEGISEGGSRPYKSRSIERYIDEGIWVLVESPEDIFSQETASESGNWTLHNDGAFSVNINAKGICDGIGVGISTQQLKENLTEKYGTLGVARPILETRKIGKNRIELVDNGFPNALWEIARLMTKAQEVKGYKDHDWKNLPIETFHSAASRHRMKTNMGELYDDEFEGFEILHKVNEAFNVLAELELILTKKSQ